MAAPLAFFVPCKVGEQLVTRRGETKNESYHELKKTTTMKKKLSTVSPFLLLLLPFFVALTLAWSVGSYDTESIREHLALNASFITVPELNLFQALVWWR